MRSTSGAARRADSANQSVACVIATERRDWNGMPCTVSTSASAHRGLEPEDHRDLPQLHTLGLQLHDPLRLPQGLGAA
jgi:hypothetical protein